MKSLRYFLFVPVVYLVFALFSVPITSCTKTKIVRDTTTVVVRDTVFVTDTVVIK